MKKPEPIDNPDALRFAIIDGKLWAAWAMLDGNIMAGTLVRERYDSYTVLRVDGSTCHVPTDRMYPASPDDILAACYFYSTTPPPPPH